LSKIEKLVGRLLTKPTDMRFSEVRIIVEHHGFTLRRGGKNHIVVRNQAGRTITLAVEDNRVKRGYLVELIKLLDLGENDYD